MVSATGSAPAASGARAAGDASEVFSVQLGDSGNGGWHPLDSAESAGAFPMTNWNAVSVNTFGGNSWVEQTFPLNDQYGIGSGVDLIVRGASDAWRYNDPLASMEPRNKLMNSFIKTSWRDEFGPNALGAGKMELILTNLNDAVTYSAYIYLANETGDDANVDAGTGVTNYTGVAPGSLPATFIASTNQNQFGTRDLGNYVRQSGLSPSNGMIKITVNYNDPDFVKWGAGVAGLQLVKESLDVFGPVFDPQPASQRVLTNTTATVIAGALGSPVPTVQQWYEIVGGVASPISGETSPSYTTPPVTDATSGQGYFMTASSGLGTASSEVAYVTGAHSVSPATGLLQVDQYYVTNSTLADVLDPFWLAANTPSNTYWIDNFENISELPDNTTERIYGFFTPPVTTNYVFFISADDDALLLLSTDDDPANRHQIAYEEFWSADGTSWTSSGGSSLVSQKRSDQFSYNPLLPGTSWPTGNTISLTAGESYYIEVGHRQGGGGQSAAVTYTFAGDPDPVDGTETVITSEQISTFSSTENLQPAPVPHIASSASISDYAIYCSNGRVNGMYDVLSSDDLTTPLGSWTVEETGFFDASGNFVTIITTGLAEPVRFYRVLSLD
jgi:hypothetical protein